MTAILEMKIQTKKFTKPNRSIQLEKQEISEMIKLDLEVL
jgi:hypothetical protein